MEEYHIFEGRPTGVTCIENEEKTYNFLDSISLSYRTLKHPKADTMEECLKVRDRINAPVAKNLFLTNKQQTQFYLLLTPGEKVFKTKFLSSQINSARLSFANEEHMQKLLGVKPGSVTVLGLMNDTENKVKLLIDEDLKQEAMFACHPCINTASVVFSFKDLIEKVIPSLSHSIHWVSLPWQSE